MLKNNSEIPNKNPNPKNFWLDFTHTKWCKIHTKFHKKIEFSLLLWFENHNSISNKKKKCSHRRYNDKTYKLFHGNKFFHLFLFIRNQRKKTFITPYFLTWRYQSDKKKLAKLFINLLKDWWWIIKKNHFW